MNKKDETACNIINTNLLPRMRFLRRYFAAMTEIENEKGGDFVYDGVVIALDDIMGITSGLIDMLENQDHGEQE